MEAFLRELLPRLLGDVPFAVHSFQCKRDLLDRLSDRLRGYAAWLPENYRQIIGWAGRTFDLPAFIGKIVYEQENHSPCSVAIALDDV